MAPAGTVRPLVDLSAEDVKAAQKQLGRRIKENQENLEILITFKEENAELRSIVRHLPDRVSHSIMVPFGKAAFFPGRLIHTNEFIVLLGEGIYAERSHKQTVEILERRSNFLEEKINALDAIIKDLKAEANFLHSNVMDSAAGVVEIIEEIEEEELNKAKKGIISNASTSYSKLPTIDNVPSTSESMDEIHARMMNRLNELELAENDFEKKKHERENDTELNTWEEEEEVEEEEEDEDEEELEGQEFEYNNDEESDYGEINEEDMDEEEVDEVETEDEEIDEQEWEGLEGREVFINGKHYSQNSKSKNSLDEEEEEEEEGRKGDEKIVQKDESNSLKSDAVIPGKQSRHSVPFLTRKPSPSVPRSSTGGSDRLKSESAKKETKPRGIEKSQKAVKDVSRNDAGKGVSTTAKDSKSTVFTGTIMERSSTTTPNMDTITHTQPKKASRFKLMHGSR